jgi:hypothetical protein
VSITVELYRTHTQIVDQIGRRRLKKSQTRRRTLVDGTFRSRRQNRVSRDATERNDRPDVFSRGSSPRV